MCVYALQREKEAYLLKIFELEKDLNQKQHSELEIAQLKGKLQVMKYIECGDESVVEEKLGKELEQLEKLRNALIKKERESNDELQQARTVFIEVNTNIFILLLLVIFCMVLIEAFLIWCVCVNVL